MKKIVLFALAFSITIIANTQDVTTQPVEKIKKWKISSVGGYTGLVFDSYQTMTLDQMIENSKNQEGLYELVDGMEGNYHKGVGGLSLKGEVTFQPLNFNKNERNVSQELILGGQVVIGKEAMIDYLEETDLSNDTVLTKTIILCDVENEFIATLGYRFKAPLLTHFRISSGIEANLGTTFGDNFIIMESESKGIKVDDEYGGYVEYIDAPGMNEYSDETRDAKASYFGRAYIPLRVSFPVADLLEFSGTLQTGVGFQKIAGGNTYFLKNTTAAYMGISLLF